MLKGGYWGKMARVDLTNSKVSFQKFNEEFAKKYLGGAGFAARLIWDWVPKHADPLGARNLLVFATGPFQAAPIASAGRCAAAARSPLTGFWGESNAGGHLGPVLKKSGIDAIAIAGRSKRPVYLYAHDGEVEIRNASTYWGMETVGTTDAIKRDISERGISVAAIGPAGENLVRFANILNDKHGCFGRTGMGAVMGSKNLKALVARGSLDPPLKDRDELMRIYKEEILPKVKKAEFTKINAEHGQPIVVVPREANGLLPIMNFKQDRWKEGAEKIGVPRYTEELKIKRWPCEYCVMGCHRKITAKGYPNETSGPEYETLAMLGSNLLVDDLKSIVVANDLCNRFGMDTIELGAILGWAFEGYEKRMITKADTGGIKLDWGSGEALVEMVERIANREGIGDLMAEGLSSCSSKFPESKPFAIGVMNMGVAGHDPRAFFSMVITTITSPRGSCHLHGASEGIEAGETLPELGYNEPMGRFQVKGKGEIGVVYQDIQQFWNSLTWCFPYFSSGVNLTDQMGLLKAITGWNMTPRDARTIGERVLNLQHAFNLRMGLVPEWDFVLPQRFQAPHKEGGAAGKVPPWKEILGEYYKTREWVGGMPSEGKLLDLGLEDVARELQNANK
ncbi:MAG TPA: aldehyde ferredoxin oxidoreductase family protein [Thermoplasmata archaeon]|nr:aldehyde ferredoxin oxidoreductase family protein [Thermoplasmata archaeon]